MKQNAHATGFVWADKKKFAIASVDAAIVAFLTYMYLGDLPYNCFQNLPCFF